MFGKGSLVHKGDHTYNSVFHINKISVNNQSATFSFLPYKSKPQYLVIGEPIVVDRVEEPSKEQVSINSIL